MAKFFFLFFLFLFLDISNSNPYHGLPNEVPKIPLNNGQFMPVIGLGTSVKEGSKGKEVQKAVEAGIDAGYRLIDTAQYYETEDQVGDAVRNKINQGKVTREEMFITTKLWNDQHRRDLVVPALKESLHKLGMDYVDLFLIHWPIEDFKNFTFGETDYVDTWKGMEECVDLGLAKAIGLSNFNIEQIDRILQVAQIRPAALQIEINPNIIQKELVEYCRHNGIEVIAHTPFGSLPESKRKPNSLPPKFDDPLLTSLAHKYGKNPFQILLRYLIDRRIVPIPKSGNPIRLQQNIDIFDFCLTKEEVQQINQFDKHHRSIDVPEWRPHKYYPFERH